MSRAEPASADVQVEEAGAVIPIQLMVRPGPAGGAGHLFESRAARARAANRPAKLASLFSFNLGAAVPFVSLTSPCPPSRLSRRRQTRCL